MSDIGIKEYAYLGMIVLIFAGFGWWTYHERKAEHEHDIAVQAAALARETAHVKQVEDQANEQLSKIQNQLATALATPPTPSIVVRVCSATAAHLTADRAPSAAIPSDAASGPSSGMGSSGEEPDIAPVTERILARDKAVIDYLQGYIRTCQQAGVCQKETP